jgi:hypothetical protein
MGRGKEVVGAHPDQVGRSDQRVGCRPEASHGLARLEPTQQALPAQRHGSGRDRGPFRSELAGDRTEEHGVGIGPTGRERGDRDQVGDLDRELDAPRRPLVVDEDRATPERGDAKVDPGITQGIELGRGGSLRVGTHQSADVQAEVRKRQGGIRHGAADAPAARIAIGQVARGRADDEDGGAACRARPIRGA